MEFTLSITKGDSELHRTFLLTHEQLSDDTELEEMFGKASRELIASLLDPHKPF